LINGTKIGLRLTLFQRKENSNVLKKKIVLNRGHPAETIKLCFKVILSGKNIHPLF
jgi:hypothetical protein